MAIKLRCPACRQKIRYAQAPDGSVGRCPRCNAVVLTMDDDPAAEDPDSPAASHDAVVPGPRRRTRPDDETAVFRPLFAPPAPAVAAPHAVIPTASFAPPVASLPPRRSVLFRRGLSGAASFPARRAVVARPDSSGSLLGGLFTALAACATISLALVGAAVLGLWFVVMLTQFP